MKRYKITISDEAIKNMDDLYNYIAYVLLEPKYALNQYNRIAYAILELDLMPERYSRFNDRKELRRMVVDNYSVFYFIKGDEVIITNVLYSAMNVFKH